MTDWPRPSRDGYVERTVVLIKDRSKIISEHFSPLSSSANTNSCDVQLYITLPEKNLHN